MERKKIRLERHWSDGGETQFQNSDGWKTAAAHHRSNAVICHCDINATASLQQLGCGQFFFYEILGSAFLPQLQKANYCSFSRSMKQLKYHPQYSIRTTYNLSHQQLRNESSRRNVLFLWQLYAIRSVNVDISTSYYFR